MCKMRRFTTPFTCSICKTEFCNPISLVKHVELEHQTELELSNIDFTRTEHRTQSGLLIESIIVCESKTSKSEFARLCMSDFLSFECNFAKKII